MLNVLLVDDEFLVRLAFSNTIHWAEHDLNLIGTASNGVEAYEIIQKKRPDIVITDLTMPRMGGLELIEKTMEAGFKCEFVVLSCHNEFEYVKQSLRLGVFDYILKLSMNMTELLDILDRLTQKILSERSVAVPTLEVFEQQDMSDTMFWVVVFGTDVNDRDHFNQQAVGIIEQITGGISGKSVLIYKNIPVLLMWETCDGLLELLEQIQEDIKRYLDIRVEIGIGTSVCGNTHIRESFDAAMTAYHNRFYQGESSISFYEDVAYLDNQAVDFSDAFPGISKGGLRLGFTRETRTAVTSSLNRMLDWKKMEPSQMRMYVHELLTRIKLRVDEQTPDVITGPMYSDIYQKVNKLEYLEHINEELVYFMDLVLERMNLAEEHPLVQGAKQYVHTHLNEDLKVLELSKHLGVSPDYFSHLFRTETGIRYIDYVNHVRIQHACERLKYSNDKIYEIGEQCGFENTNYFIKVFKKHMGMTPLDYKREQENMKI